MTCIECDQNKWDLSFVFSKYFAKILAARLGAGLVQMFACVGQTINPIIYIRIMQKAFTLQHFIIQNFDVAFSFPDRNVTLL